MNASTLEPQSKLKSPSSKRRLRVGVDFHSFEGIFQGSRARLLALFPHLFRALGDDLDLVLFSGNPEGLRAALPSVDASRVTFVKLESKGALGRLIFEFPRLVKAHRLDAFHSQYVLPVGINCGKIVSIHDILFESHPQFFGRLFTLRSKLMMRRSARIAEAVITISDFSRDEIERRYGVPREKISTIPCAVDRERFSPGAVDTNALAARGLSPQGYLLVVGRIDPRKNSVAVVRAYSEQCVSKEPLVLVGQVADEATARELDNLKLDGGKRVLVFGDVTDAELPGLYAGAKAFFFPSFAEGFGMPILEAMAAGAPVLTSNTTSMPEVAAEAAVLIDPSSDLDLRKGMELLLAPGEEGASLRSDLRARGLLRAGEYSWKQEALRLGDLYRQVAMAAARR